MKKLILILAWVAVFGLAFYLRTDGLYRGLATGGIYHPDEPKQVIALSRYMQDKYLWQVGSIFYDGYPYGLNHVDEWILRPVLGLKNAFTKHFSPDREIARYPSVSDLYYLSRALRVVYGLLVLLLCIAVSRRMAFPKPAVWYAGLLLALAPISISVSHFATGDIGTDLFSTLMLPFLYMYSRARELRWLFISGLAVGMSFACKYNGLLSGGAAGLYLVFHLILTKDWKMFLRAAAVLIAGVAAGIIVLTPALLLDWGQTSEDIVANFAFIRRYGAGSWWEELSFVQKAAHILFKTTPQILSHLGWFVMLGAVAGAIFSFRDTIRLMKEKVDSCEFRKSSFATSIFLYPFVALFLALAGKPEVQPFHFSYLQIPFVIACAYFVAHLMNCSGRPSAKVAAGFIVLFSVLELGMTASRDSFFWARQDNGFLQHQVPQVVFIKEGRYVGARSKVREIYLEPESASVFRNRRKHLELYGGSFWNDMQIAAVPSIPYPGDHDWIYHNGPAFPRNERMFVVRHDCSEEKHVVFHEKPHLIRIGIRSGSWPVVISLKVGGVESEVTLAPNAQVVTEIEPESWRTVKGGAKETYLVPIETEAMIGDAYISILASDKEVQAFKYFGGDTDAVFADLVEGLEMEKLLKELGRTRYIESEQPPARMLGKGGDDTEFKFPQWEYDGFTEMPLPQGSYVFECEAFVASDSASVLIQVDDAGLVPGFKSGDAKMDLVNGYNLIRYEFSKSFAPYQCCVLMTSLSGQVRVGDWKLKPLLRKHGDRNLKPNDYDELADGAGAGSLFGGALRLTKIAMPAKLKLEEPFYLGCGMEIESSSFNNFGEHSVFVHWTDSEGKQVYATGFPLARAFAGGDQSVIDCGVPDVDKPGVYLVEIGIVNGRTGKRLSVQGPDARKEDRQKRKIFIGKLSLY